MPFLSSLDFSNTNSWTVKQFGSSSFKNCSPRNGIELFLPFYKGCTGPINIGTILKWCKRPLASRGETHSYLCHMNFSSWTFSPLGKSLDGCFPVGTGSLNFGPACKLLESGWQANFSRRRLCFQLPKNAFGCGVIAEALGIVSVFLHDCRLLGLG